jgi:DNA-binding protein HU-beta
MNKTEFIQEVAKKASATKSSTEKFLDAFIDVVAAELKKGEKVQLTGFGTFDAKEKPAREGINPRTGAKIQIQACKSISFKPGNTLKSLL